MITPTLLAAALVLTGDPQDGPIVGRDRLDRAPPLPAASATTAAPAPTADVVLAPFVLEQVVYDANPQVRALIEPGVRPFIGQTLDAAGVARLRAAVSASLGEAAALPIIAVDTRESAAGRLKITAIPGRVGRVGIYGDVQRDVELMRRYAARLAGEAPLTRRTGERYLSLIADIPGARTTLQSAPSATTRGAVDLGFDVDFKRWETDVAVNNRGSRTLGRTQVTAGVTLNGGVRMGDQTRLAVTLPTDPDRFQYVSLSHRQPIGYDGAAVTVSAGRLRTRVENLSGDATTASAVVSWPLIRGYRSNVVLSGGVDGLNSDNAIFGDLRATERTRAARASVAWGETWSNAALTAGLTLSQGIDGLGAQVDDFTDADFAKVNGRVDLVRAIGRQVRLSGTLAAQWSDDRAPTAELFSLGGSEFGRGFSQGLLVGDSGYGAKVEAAWRPGFLPRQVLGSELYAFADGGEATVNARDPFEGRSDALLSAGVGVRVALGTRAVIEVEGARALDDPRPGAGESTRLGLGVTARF
ncbi:MAG: ShlB/FhaC/HecB family hemolysin secretion/activation protein [Brevundimonas sp.]|nr:MAG: ShlB/FhaC/HecB family hemolysin secretion/activation protein [Brevundimonas sp.]